MKDLYLYPVFIDLFFYTLLKDIYSIFSFIYDLLFKYCPVYYQFGYGYCMLIYYFRRKKASKNNWCDFFENSSLNYLLMQFLYFFKKIVNINILLFSLKLFLKKIIFFIKHLFLTNHRYNIIYYYVVIREYLSTYFWRPVFKKLSYIGVFTFIRSKWYKNK